MAPHAAALSPSVAPRAPHVVAIAFDSPRDASHAFHTAMSMQEHQQLAVHDAVFVSRKDRGRATISPTLDPTPIAVAVPSSLLGAVIGTLVAGPLGFLIGGVLAGTTGALVTKLVDTGIPDRVVARLRELVKPGETVLAILVSDSERAIDELRRYPGAHVVYTD